MRYTTVIDIMDIPSVRRCRSASWLYYVMAMKCGYHDEDRDVLDMSLTRLAAVSGLTVSAVRHALNVLTRANLVRRNGQTWTVRKWLPEQAITARPKTKRQEKAVELQREEERERQQRAAVLEAQRRQRDELFKQGKSSFIVYCENLKRKAEAGDEEAAQAFKRNSAAYERAIRAMKQQTQ